MHIRAVRTTIVSDDEVRSSSHAHALSTYTRSRSVRPSAYRGSLQRDPPIALRGPYSIQSQAQAHTWLQRVPTSERLPASLQFRALAQPRARTWCTCSPATVPGSDFVRPDRSQYRQHACLLIRDTEAPLATQPQRWAAGRGSSCSWPAPQPVV